MSKNQYDVIVVGAGISGLSFAYYSALAGKKVAVIEKNGRAGGCFHSHRFTGEAEGFWLEMGAHTCYNSYLNLIDLLEKSSIISELKPRQKVPFRMYVNGRIVSVPSQLNFFELLSSLPRIFTAKKEGESVKSYYSRLLGSGNYEKVFSPAFNAVLSQPADAFPADMLFKKRARRRKEIVKSFTLLNGLGVIAETLSSQSGIDLILDTEVTTIDYSGATFKVGSEKSNYEAPALAIAVPPPYAADMLNTSFPEVSAELRKIRTEKIETMGVALAKKDIQTPPLAGIIGLSQPFYSVVSRDTVPDEKWRGFAFHFRPQLLNDEEKLQKIAEVLSVKRGALTNAASRQSLLPSLSVGHEEIVRLVNRHISGKPLFITGNYFFGLAIEDCVSRSFDEFSRMIASGKS